jgi:hypothetical protein
LCSLIAVRAAEVMPITDPTSFRDKTIDWLEFFHATRRDALRRLMTPELIEEHRADPRGATTPHSADLQQILNYLRMSPVASKLFAYAQRPHEAYLIGAITARGQHTETLPGGPYGSEREAVHEVFLRRLIQNELIDGYLIKTGG